MYDLKMFFLKGHTTFKMGHISPPSIPLQREQQRRRDKEKEVDTLKRSTTSMMGKQSHSPAGRIHDHPTNSHDSDSGIR